MFIAAYKLNKSPVGTGYFQARPVDRRREKDGKSRYKVYYWSKTRFLFVRFNHDLKIVVKIVVSRWCKFFTTAFTHRVEIPPKADIRPGAIIKN